MVYTQINIVKGAVISVEDAIRLLDFYSTKSYKSNRRFDVDRSTETIYQIVDIDDQYWDIADKVNRYLSTQRGRLQLFTFPCCSPFLSKKYILGEKVEEIARTEQNCPQCSDLFLCKRCIGATVQGYYDVEKILNEILIADPSDVIDIDPSCYYVQKICNNLFKTKCDCQFYYMLDDCLSCT